jgi:hypothetical protein
VTLRTQSMARFSECRNHFGGYYQHDNWPGSWHWRPINPGWGWCGNYWFDFEIDLMFICCDDYCFSEYWFEVETGRFFWFNNGGSWIDCLPDTYHEPITIRVSETVPVLDDGGNVIAFETQTFLYVALWDDATQIYGYYDWQDNYHVVTFPWLASW